MQYGSQLSRFSAASNYQRNRCSSSQHCLLSKIEFHSYYNLWLFYLCLSHRFIELKLLLSLSLLLYWNISSLRRSITDFLAWIFFHINFHSASLVVSILKALIAFDILDVHSIFVDWCFYSADFILIKWYIRFLLRLGQPFNHHFRIVS